MARRAARSLQQVYALEGWRGVAAIVPEIAAKVDADGKPRVGAQRSAAYRMAHRTKDRRPGHEGEMLKKQPLSKAGRTAVNRRAGRLLARTPERDAQGRQKVNELGIPKGSPISPLNNAKLAIHKINSKRRLVREASKSQYERGRITQDLHERQMSRYARMTASQKNTLTLAAQEGRWVDFREGEMQYDEDGEEIGRSGGYEEKSG